MTFSKQNDGCWHWEYHSGQSKRSSRILLMVWASLMILLMLAMGGTAFLAKVPRSSIPILLVVFGGIGLFVSVVFFIIWLYERFGKKKLSYTASEQVFSPFSTLHTNWKGRIFFEQVRSITRCREQNIILLKDAAIPVSIYAEDDDYEAVWDFLREHCPRAEIIEKAETFQKH